ncbi:MAG: peroxide stress protein YaaA [Cyanobacteria bacterium P01_F01_bin.150]
MLMVISPAKTLDFSGSPYPHFTQPTHIEDSQELINQLREFSVADIGQLMKISEKLSILNQQRYEDFQTPFTLDNAQQALFVFKGDVYKGIDIDNYDDEDLAFAQAHLRILSGLYGILRPLDLMQAYRLEMGTKLVNKRGKNLYEFWGNQISEQLNEELAQQVEPWLVNLASNEYFKAIAPKALNARLLNIAFKENKSGTYKVIGIHAKRARGLMVNFIIKNRIETPEPIKTFDVEGYAFNEELSTPDTWTFCRG